MDNITIQKLQQFLRAARALQNSIENADDTTSSGVGRIAVKQYNGIQRKIAELVPDDFYITETLTLDIEAGMSEEAMATQVMLVTNQLIVYIEGLIRENRQAGAPLPMGDMDSLRSLSDQIINMTKATIRRAMSNVDVDFNIDFDSSSKSASGSEDVNLEGANLEDANYSGRDLRGANLDHANVRGANFSGTNLRDANLEGADAEGANFSGVNLRGANLAHANFGGANLTGANLRDGNLEDGNFTNARLDGANLRDSNLERANLTGARLDGANLRDANLEHADLTGARLDGANLRDANLDGATLPDNFRSMGAIFGGSGAPRPPTPPRPPMAPRPPVPMGKRKIEIEFDSNQGFSFDTDAEDDDVPDEKPKNDDLV